MKKPIILFIVNVDWFFLSHRLPLAQAAIEKGYEVHIATTITDGLKQLELHGLIVHPVSMSRADSNLITSVKVLNTIFKLYRRLQPDLIHLVTIKPVIFGGIAARFARVPAVLIAISGLGSVFVTQGFKANVRKGLIKVLYRLALDQRNMKIIFQNQNDCRCISKLINLPAEKIINIPGSGVDLKRYAFTPIPLGVPIIMMASRLLSEKGVREFVQAAILLKQSFGSALKFVLVGTSDIENPTGITEEELDVWRRDAVVELWGYQSEMSVVLAQATIVVLPSYYGEGLPKVLIEAAACGRPVITTDHPGCRDAIEPGTTGLLVPIRNAEAVAQSVKRLIDNPELCEKMGRAGRNLAERMFDIENVISTHMQIYDELIKKVSK